MTFNFLKHLRQASDFLTAALNTAIFNNKSDGSARDKEIRHFYQSFDSDFSGSADANIIYFRCPPNQNEKYYKK